MIEQESSTQKKSSLQTSPTSTEFQSLIVSNTIASNGPIFGPSFITHMDQQNNDQSVTDFTQQQQQQQHQNQDQHQSAADFIDAIVTVGDITHNQDDAHVNNQLDCGNLNAIQTTVEELLAQTQTQVRLSSKIS